MPERPLTAVSVVGAGGIGCAVGYALRAGGLDVTFVDADRRKVDWGNSRGVGLDLLRFLPARFVHFDQWHPNRNGIVLLCTKCYDNKRVLDRLPASINVVPIQNGFDRDLIERSEIEGIASFISECIPHRTHTRITRPGSLHIGYWGKSRGRSLPADVDHVIRLLERYGRFHVKRVEDILPYKYAKLMYNAAISPLAAVAGLDNGELLTHRTARTLFFTLLRENYDTLKHARVTLGQVGPLHPDSVNRILRWPFVARALAWPFTMTLRHTYCSMSGDLPKGRTEIDNLNGHLIELAGDRACVLNRTVYALVKRMEQEQLVPAVHWLEEIAA